MNPFTQLPPRSSSPQPALQPPHPPMPTRLWLHRHGGSWEVCILPVLHRRGGYFHRLPPILRGRGSFVNNFITRLRPTVSFSPHRIGDGFLASDGPYARRRRRRKERRRKERSTRALSKFRPTLADEVPTIFDPYRLRLIPSHRVLSQPEES